MLKFFIFLFTIITYNSLSIAMENKPYHHLPDGTFRNPKGSPVRSENTKWSYRTFNKEKKKQKKGIKKKNGLKNFKKKKKKTRHGCSKRTCVR